MYISYNRLKELIDFNYSPEQLDHILTMLGIEVEAINDFAKKYDKFYIGEVLTKEKHPQADKLSICTVNYGVGQTTVICGAPNVEQGQKIVFASLGAVVPQGDFKIEKRKIRGVQSEGMICSQFELDLGEDKSGIWVLDESAVVGTPLADFMNINDTILDISVTPNRPDCLSHFGLAREIAAYKSMELKQQIKFHRPNVDYSCSANDISNSASVEIKNHDLCPKYVGIVVKNAEIKESPDWLKNKIKMLGLRPINCVVDVTNYVMYETGQPLHAFDLDKIAGKKVIIKTAKEGDKFTTLDAKERSLNSDMLMICDAEKPIAIAGVMGGENSEITNDTKNIFIESAFFNPSSIRRTSKKLGLSTDASYRFERGVDFNNVLYSAKYAAKLISELTGGAVDKGIIEAMPEDLHRNITSVRIQKAIDLIGVELDRKAIVDILKSLEFEIMEENDELIKVKIPSYRVDISIEVDVIEEIARMYNYDNIQPNYTTTLNFSGSGLSNELAMPKMRPQIRNYFVQNGFTEILTQNIIDPASAAMFTENPVAIANPLGEEMSIMRPSLIPSMLKTIERNIRIGNTNLMLFEIGKQFNQANLADNTFVNGIKETEFLTVGISGNKKPAHWLDKQVKVDYYDIRGIYEDFVERFRLSGIKLVKDDYLKNIFSGNALTIFYKGDEIGKFGEVSKKLLKKMDIGTDVFLFTVNLEKLYIIKTKEIRYTPVSPYPTVKRDLGFVMDKSHKAGDVRDTILKTGGEYLQSVEIFDVFEGEKIGKDKKNIAFSLVYSSAQRTLMDEDVDASITVIIAAVEQGFGAVLREF